MVADGRSAREAVAIFVVAIAFVAARRRIVGRRNLVRIVVRVIGHPVDKVIDTRNPAAFVPGVIVASYLGAADQVLDAGDAAERVVIERRLRNILAAR